MWLLGQIFLQDWISPGSQMWRIGQIFVWRKDWVLKYKLFLLWFNFKTFYTYWGLQRLRPLGQGSGHQLSESSFKADFPKALPKQADFRWKPFESKVAFFDSSSIKAGWLSLITPGKQAVKKAPGKRGQHFEKFEARQMRIISFQFWSRTLQMTRQKLVPQVRASFTKDVRAWNARSLPGAYQKTHNLQKYYAVGPFFRRRPWPFGKV